MPENTVPAVEPKSGYGLDPGKRACGVAIVKGDKVLAVWVVQCPSVKEGYEMPALMNRVIEGLQPADVFTVENQQLYEEGKAKPQDLLHLAHVAGSCAGAAAFKAETVYFPLPATWKKGVPKGVHQSRVLDKLGWSYTFNGPKKPVSNVQYPEGVKLGTIPAKHTSEAVDAIALALWGVKRAA